VGDWRRSTEERSYGDFPPEVQSSIVEYAEKHALGNVGADATFSAVTLSEQKKLFGTRRQATFIVVTPTLLVWALSDRGDVTTVAVKRSEVEITEFQAQLVDDTGLEVFGFVPLGASERGTVFVGLGSEPAAWKLRGILGIDTSGR
jgi:hypothetical protein